MKACIDWSADNREITDRVLKAYSGSPWVKNVLEIGMGHSTEVLLKGVASKQGTVWSMDKGDQKVSEQEGATLVKLIGNSLVLPWERPIDLLYIDGCHRPKHVLKELAKFARFVNPGGFILFDDVRHYEKPRLEPVIDAWCQGMKLGWYYPAPEPNGVAVVEVTRRLGEIPQALIQSSTDCEWCE